MHMTQCLHARELLVGSSAIVKGQVSIHGLRKGLRTRRANVASPFPTV
jgi:hypothetical protein